MTTSPTTVSSSSSSSSAARVPLRLRLRESTSTDRIDGAWWPQSRDLQLEAADLVDHFPGTSGYVNRLLFSRPDWDDVVADGRGVRRIQARRGPVKVGSFPSDDTRVMVLLMASGQRLRLRVVPSAAEPAEADQQLHDVADAGTDDGGSADWMRWDEEDPTES